NTVSLQLACQSHGFGSAPAVPEDDDAGLVFFFRGQRSIVVPVQAPHNFLVSLTTVAVGEALHVHALAIFVAEVLDHLHRTVRARVVLDEAADEPDDHDWRHYSILDGSDGSGRSCFSEGEDK